LTWQRAVAILFFAVNDCKTRRTGGTQAGERAARVVEDVLRATAEELSKVGYAALRIDEVATRSGVNKTSIYRRWPSKAELVVAAFAAQAPDAELADTGDLRADLLQAMKNVVRDARSPLGRGFLRMLQSERCDPEVEKLATGLRTRLRAGRVRLVQRAIDRGDLPAGTRADLIADLVFSPVYLRYIVLNERLDLDYIQRIVDTVLAGARANPSAPGSP
jgi:AcrR family transcriptional regulator